MDAAQSHCQKAAGEKLEAMGLLAGTAAKWQGKPYAVIDEYITAENDATSVSVRFGRGAFAALAEKVNEARSKGKLVVGWAHCHPDYGCFLSSTDVRTQRQYFAEEFNIALVIDPVRNEKKVFKLSQDAGEYRPAGYAVVARK